MSATKPIIQSYHMFLNGTMGRDSTSRWETARQIRILLVPILLPIHNITITSNTRDSKQTKKIWELTKITSIIEQETTHFTKSIKSKWWSQNIPSKGDIRVPFPFPICPSKGDIRDYIRNGLIDVCAGFIFGRIRLLTLPGIGLLVETAHLQSS